MDCEGVFPFVAMDFDHRPDEDKEFGISNFGMWSETEKNIAIVEIEISKCDLVCSNCHRVRTRDRWKDD